MGGILRDKLPTGVGNNEGEPTGMGEPWRVYKEMRNNN